VVAEVQAGSTPASSSSFSVAAGDNVTVDLGVSDAAVAVDNVEITDADVTPPPVIVPDGVIEKAAPGPTATLRPPSATPTRTSSPAPTRTATPLPSPTPRPSATPQPQKTPVNDFEPVDTTNDPGPSSLNSTSPTGPGATPVTPQPGGTSLRP
jgi:hypothetical protein